MFYIQPNGFPMSELTKDRDLLIHLPNPNYYTEWLFPDRRNNQNRPTIHTKNLSFVKALILRMRLKNTFLSFSVSIFNIFVVYFMCCVSFYNVCILCIMK